ncbi:MAG: glycogen synthase [Acidimicrobiia bacterium]|nr:glycogen synthase [Acidimicrobiia bacterium]
MNLLFVVAEMAPFATSGGLGDAITGIAHALARLEQSVTVLMPRYQWLGDLGEARPGEGPARGIYHHEEAGIRVLLVDDPESFDRPGIYGPEPGSAYEDEWRRWGRFCQTAVAVSGQFDLVHLHDAQTAPTALLSSAPTVLTLHNAAYSVQGPLDEAVALFEGHPDAADLLEWYGAANYLKGGILAADQVTTVSPGYARQIAEDPAVSSGLNEFVAGLDHAVVGILNGIEIRRFDPETDDAIPVPFGPDDLTGRSAARQELLARTGLDGSGVLFGMVGRMTGQKGLELLDPVIDQLIGSGFRLVAVGNGDQDYLVDGWAARAPGAVWHGPYSEELARLVWAGGDSFLMPSRFEPGGLGNLYAMRYGAPPVVRLTGGLASTVIDLTDHPASANGFGFEDYTPEALRETVERAMGVLRDQPDVWAALQRAGMTTDWGWDPAARRYLDLYERVLSRS